MKSCKAEFPFPATFPPKIQYRQEAKMCFYFCHTFCLVATYNSTIHCLTSFLTGIQGIHPRVVLYLLLTAASLWQE